jgi:alkyl sulfatase BDS1-like metallo-beta-lactamase superfamily hydrolase
LCRDTHSRQFFAMQADHARAADLRVEGRREALPEMLALLDPFDYWLDIVTPQGGL